MTHSTRHTMNILVIFSLLFTLGETASLKADKRANGGIQCTATPCNGAVTGAPVTRPVTIPAAGTCVHPVSSQLYQNGQTYPSADGCNTCTCTNGNIVCTQNTCTMQGIGGTCVDPVTSQLYQNGQTYRSSDACNTCTCTNGNIACTHNTCTGQGSGLNIGVNLHPGGNAHTGSTCYDNTQHLFHNDGDSYTSLDGCNTCTCSTGILSCTNRQCNTGTGNACYDIATNKYYTNGQVVRASDGCNTCTCSNSQFLCTHLMCSPIG